MIDEWKKKQVRHCCTMVKKRSRTRSRTHQVVDVVVIDDGHGLVGVVSGKFGMIDSSFAIDDKTGSS